MYLVYIFFTSFKLPTLKTITPKRTWMDFQSPFVGT